MDTGPGNRRAGLEALEAGVRDIAFSLFGTGCCHRRGMGVLPRAPKSSSGSRTLQPQLYASTHLKAQDEEAGKSLQYSPPAISLTGIVGQDSRRMAIVKGSSATRILKVGAMWSDYLVSEIGSKSLTFTIGDKDFRYQLEPELEG